MNHTKKTTQFWLKRVVLSLVVFLIAPLPIGFVWQALAQNAERKNILPLGKLVEVQGHLMHIHCTGQGSPTVILEGGVPEWSIHWQALQPELAKVTRVCSYDRAGYGWSEPATTARTAQNIVNELHSLLQNAGEASPFIYVAHSFWGPNALLYQQRYPQEIAGIVLLEAWSPELYTPVPQVITQSLPLAQTLKTIAPLGQVRLVGELGIIPLADMLKLNLLPEAMQPAYKAAYYDGKMWGAMYDEYSAMEESGRQTENLTSLADLPLVVLQAGIRAADDYPPSEVWNATQKQLVELSSNSQFILVEGSGHFVQLEKPELLVAVLQQMLEQVR